MRYALKKIMVVFVMMMILFAWNDLAVYAIDMTEGFTYSVNEDKTITITGYEGTPSGDLIIPSVIDGYKVTRIGNYAFDECSGFTGDLKLPEGLTSIGNYAFIGCSGFTGDLKLPEGLTSIGDNAFDECSGFTGDLKLPEGLTSIGKWAFIGCSGFTGDLKLPEGLTSIGDRAFGGCSGFDGILDLPEGLKSIGIGVFAGCGFTGDLKLPEGLTSIGDEAFFYCENLNGELYLPEGLTSIGVNAFANCWLLESDDFYLPESVTSIGRDAFLNCVKLKSKEIYLSEKITNIERSIFFNCQFEKVVILNKECVFPEFSPFSYSTIIKGYADSTAHAYAIEHNREFECIEHKFSDWCNAGEPTCTVEGSKKRTCQNENCEYSETEVVEAVGHTYKPCVGGVWERDCINCEHECDYRYDITDNGEAIIKWCFLTGNVNIPSEIDGYPVTTIGAYAFSGADMWCLISNLTIPEGVTTIESYAFAYNDRLETITIPNSVINIGNRAFYDDYGFESQLTDVYYSGNKIQRSNINIGEENLPLLNAKWHYSPCEVHT